MIGNFTFAAEYQVFEVGSETAVQTLIPHMLAITNSATVRRGQYTEHFSKISRL